MYADFLIWLVPVLSTQSTNHVAGILSPLSLTVLVQYMEYSLLLLLYKYNMQWYDCMFYMLDIILHVQISYCYNKICLTSKSNCLVNPLWCLFGTCVCVVHCVVYITLCVRRLCMWLCVHYIRVCNVCAYDIYECMWVCIISMYLYDCACKCVLVYDT